MGGLDWTIKSAGLSLIAAGAGLVRKGHMSAGNLTSFTMYVARCTLRVVRRASCVVRRALYGVTN